jgi:Gpi18-like mannosyltransferase
LVRLYLLGLDAYAANHSYGGNVTGPLLSWDAWHYLAISRAGYPRTPPHVGGLLIFSNAAFEPAFPAMIRLVTLLGVPFISAGLVVSILGGAGATYFVWRIAQGIASPVVSRDAAILFMVLPGQSVAWGLLYSEGLGIALAAACLYFFVRERYLAAGILGALATLTSPMALCLVVPMAWALLVCLWRRRHSRTWIALLLTPLGFLSYAAFLSLRNHDALYWLHLQRQAWGESFDYGTSLIRLLHHWTQVAYQGPAYLEWIAVICVLGLLAAVWRAKLPVYLSLYSVAVLLLLFGTNSLGFKPRFLVWAFPLVIAASKSLTRPWRYAVIGASALAIAPLFIAYTTMGNSVAQP